LPIYEPGLEELIKQVHTPLISFLTFSFSLSLCAHSRFLWSQIACPFLLVVPIIFFLSSWSRSQVRGRNLFFSTDVKGAIEKGDVIFVSVNTSTKEYGLDAGASRFSSTFFFPTIFFSFSIFSNHSRFSFSLKSLTDFLSLSSSLQAPRMT
jgi:hypothetical protein